MHVSSMPLVDRPCTRPTGVGLEHPQGQNVFGVLWVPPCTGDLDPDLNDMSMPALDFAVRRAPALVVVVGVGDGVVVSLEVGGFETQRRYVPVLLPPGRSSGVLLWHVL